MSQPQPDAPLDLDAIQARCDAATDGQWWIDENDQVWTLHGVHARIPSSVPEIGEQILNRQILKAPKTGTPYAEYWPSPADAEFIVNARQDVPALLARVRELEAEVATERAVAESNQRAARLLAEDVQRLEAELRRERAAHSSTIDERDRASDYADRLAAGLAPIDVRGEHSVGNCPWQNALDYAETQSTV